MKFTFSMGIYGDEWYWNLKSKGKVVADGGGYDQLRYLIKTLKSIFKDSPARMKEIEKEAKRLGFQIAPTIKRIEAKSSSTHRSAERISK